MYRISSDLAPYATHPEMPQFHGQINDCLSELRALGGRARALKLRLSFHPSQFIVLNSPDPVLVAKSIWDLTTQAEILDHMELGPEAVIVVHAGGTYGDRDVGYRRWVETYKTLSPAIRRRLVLENDDLRYSAADVLRIHNLTGVPLVFDHQHFCCFNPERLTLKTTVQKFLATWPGGVRPKIHFSSPRTELRQVKVKVRGQRKTKLVLQPPVWTGHADYVNPFAFANFMEAIGNAGVDIMLEAKAKDLALLRLRQDLSRYSPRLAPRFGLKGAPVISEAEVPELLISEDIAGAAILNDNARAGV